MIARTSFNRRLPVVAACAALAIVVLSVDIASACPSCKAALASEGQGDLVSGFFYSILFMLSMPFAIFGSFSSYMYLLVRRARREQVASGQSADQKIVSAGTDAVKP